VGRFDATYIDKNHVGSPDYVHHIRVFLGGKAIQGDLLNCEGHLLEQERKRKRKNEHTSSKKKKRKKEESHLESTSII